MTRIVLILMLALFACSNDSNATLERVVVQPDSAGTTLILVRAYVAGQDTVWRTVPGADIRFPDMVADSTISERVELLRELLDAYE